MINMSLFNYPSLMNIVLMQPFKGEVSDPSWYLLNTQEIISDILVIVALMKLRPEDCKSEVNVGYFISCRKRKGKKWALS